MFKTCCPLNGNCFQPEDWCTENLHPAGENTTGKPITQRWMPLPSFAEIARSLQGDDSPCITINVPQEQTLPQVVGSTMVMSRMVQDVWGMMTIDMMTYQLNVMGLGSANPTPPSPLVKCQLRCPLWKMPQS